MEKFRMETRDGMCTRQAMLFFIPLLFRFLFCFFNTWRTFYLNLYPKEIKKHWRT